MHLQGVWMKPSVPLAPNNLACLERTVTAIPGRRDHVIGWAVAVTLHAFLLNPSHYIRALKVFDEDVFYVVVGRVVGLGKHVFVHDVVVQICLDNTTHSKFRAQPRLASTCSRAMWWYIE